MSLSKSLKQLAIVYAQVKNLDEETIKVCLKNADKFDFNNLPIQNDNTINESSI